MSAPRPRADILVVGQGLAGTCLAWELERAGIPFELVDHGHASAASLAAAGIINPITGRRLVKSWRVDTLLPAARTFYRELESVLEVPLWRELRVRRLFADDRERCVLAEKRTSGELAPFAGADTAIVASVDGFWIESAARVDLPALLWAARARWRSQGRLRESAMAASALAAETDHYDLVVDCTGVAGACGGAFECVPWEFSKGEMLELAVDGLALDEVINRRHWVLPLAPGVAWIGATHQPGVLDPTPTAAGRAALEASACSLLPDLPFTVTGHRAGVRVTLPDKHPVAGRHPLVSRLGVLNGLGAKGALHAPALARQWVNHLTEGVPFDAEVELGRFFRRTSSQ